MDKNNPLTSQDNSEVKNMLKSLYGIFLKRFGDVDKSWEYFLQFISLDNSSDLILKGCTKIDWLLENKRFRDSVFSVYDSNLLRSVYYDFLGELYVEISQKAQMNKTLPYKIQSQIEEINSERKNPLKILDLNMGTGRNLMALHKMYPDAVLFGVTNDLNLYRIALTNSLIFGIKCYLICADKMKHELGLNNSRGLENWKKANKWCYGISELKQNLN